MGRFHVGPSDESMALRVAYESDPNSFVAPTPSSTIEIQTQIVEKIVEVKVPEYITVIKEIKVEVPVMVEVERIVEKIIEIPKIQIVEKPITVIREMYDVNQVLLEKRAHERTKRKLYIAYLVIVFGTLLTMAMAVK